MLDSREGFIHEDLRRAPLTDTQILGLGFCCCIVCPRVLYSVTLFTFWLGLKGGCDVGDAVLVPAVLEAPPLIPEAVQGSTCSSLTCFWHRKSGRIAFSECQLAPGIQHGPKVGIVPFLWWGKSC